jgi:Spy/CpxP family protein refolding chaperone
MKITPALAAALLLGCGAAFAAAPATTATPAAPSATPVKHTSLKACNKQAEGKKLTGADRTAFVKSCHAGKPAV